MCYFVSVVDENNEKLDQLTNDMAGLKVDVAGLKVDLQESKGQMKTNMGWLKTTFGRIEETLKTISGGRNICNVTIMFLLCITGVGYLYNTCQIYLLYIV